MTKKILTLLIVMTTIACASAQITIIPKAGVTISKVATNDDERMKSSLGFSIGAALNIEVSEILSLQPELQFIQKGFGLTYSETYTGYSEKFDGKVSITYIEAPLLIKTTFGQNVNFYINAGPSLGFGIGGKYKLKHSKSGTAVNESFTFDGRVKFGTEPDNSDGEDIYFDNRLDFGVQLGGGILIGKKIMVDLRYGLGLSNLYKKEEGMSSADAKSKNRVLQFTVGMPLPTK
jgi:hypothetical protein